VINPFAAPCGQTLMKFVGAGYSDLPEKETHNNPRKKRAPPVGEALSNPS